MQEKLGETGQLCLKGIEGDDNPLPDSFKVEVDDPHKWHAWPGTDQTAERRPGSRSRF